MPVILLDRLPLPSLQAYTIISVVLLSCSVYYAVQITSDPDWKVNSTISRSNLEPNENESGESVLPPANFHHNETVGYHLSQVVTFMIQEPLCIWVSSCKVNGLLDCVDNVELYDMVTRIVVLCSVVSRPNTIILTYLTPLMSVNWILFTVYGITLSF